MSFRPIFGGLKNNTYICAMKNQYVESINNLDNLDELLELREFLLYDLKNAVKMRERIGPNDHLDEMIDLFLDQLSLIEKKMKSIKGNNYK